MCTSAPSILSVTETYWLARKKASSLVPLAASGVRTKLLASPWSVTEATTQCCTAGCRRFARMLALKMELGMVSGAAAMALLRVSTWCRKAPVPRPLSSFLS